MWDDGDDSGGGARRGSRDDGRGASGQRGFRPPLTGAPPRRGAANLPSMPPAAHATRGPGASQRGQTPHYPTQYPTQSPQSGQRGGNAPNNPFEPYRAYDNSGGFPMARGTSRPDNGAMNRGLVASGGYAPGGYNSGFGYPAQAQPAPPPRKWRLGIAIFHDGNPGHLWRGSLASSLAEVTLLVSLVIWLATLTYSTLAVAYAVVAFAAPFMLVGPLTARLENALTPDRRLRVIGALRVLLTLALMAMHFRTILPALYLMIFLISLLGRMHDALRVAAIRVCLAPGEPEHVANDLQIGGAVVAVVGPLLAAGAYVLNGERILLCCVVSAVIFLISSNAETFLDPLPENRRAFLLVTRNTAYPDGWVAAEEDEPATSADALEEDEPPFPALGAATASDERSPEERREYGLPEWYQQGPTTGGEALAELRVGLGLAGSSGHATTALLALGVLALIGGALASLEVFYVIAGLFLPPFYLGALLAAEGCGLALGAVMAQSIAPDPRTAAGEGGGASRALLLIGMLGSGGALALLARLTPGPLTIFLALVVMLAFGLTTALAFVGARHVLVAGFTPLERRAIATADLWVGALCGLAGALLFPQFVGRYPTSSLLAPKPFLRVSQWNIPQLLFLLGVGLALGGFLVFLRLSLRLPQRAPRADATPEGRAPSALPVTEDEDAAEWDDAPDDEAAPRDEWDDERDDRRGYDAWDDGDDPEDEPPPPPARGRRSRR